MSFESIATKRGFNLTGGFWKRFGVTFIEAPVEVVSSALSDYYQAKCEINLSANSLYELTREQANKSFVWQYTGHDWTVWWTFADENIAATLALFLNTKAIVITYQGTSNWTEVKIFKDDKLIEQYYFGFEDNNLNKKIGHLFFAGKLRLGYNYWDVETVQYIHYHNILPPSTYRHLFCSSVRNLTEIEVQNILKSRTNEFGLLDITFKFHNVYFPNLSEIPLPYYHSVENFYTIDSEIVRIDSILLPEKAFYWDNILSVPKQVIKNN